MEERTRAVLDVHTDLICWMAASLGWTQELRHMLETMADNASPEAQEELRYIQGRLAAASAQE